MKGFRKAILILFCLQILNCIIICQIRENEKETLIDLKNKIEKLKSDISQITKENPVFSIVGTIKDRNDSRLLLWGNAYESRGQSSVFGNMFEEGNVIVRNYMKENIVGNTYNGLHYFIKKSYGKNAFNADVLVFEYGDFPRMSEMIMKQRSIENLVDSYKKERSIILEKSLFEMIPQLTIPWNSLKDSLNKYNSFQNIMIGSSEDEVIRLRPKRLQNNQFILYYFEKENIVIFVKKNSVVGIIKIVNGNILANYYSCFSGIENNPANNYGWNINYENVNSIKQYESTINITMNEEYQEIGSIQVSSKTSSEKILFRRNYDNYYQYSVLFLKNKSDLMVGAIGVCNPEIIPISVEELPISYSFADKDALIK